MPSSTPGETQKHLIETLEPYYLKVRRKAEGYANTPTTRTEHQDGEDQEMMSSHTRSPLTGHLLAFGSIPIGSASA